MKKLGNREHGFSQIMIILVVVLALAGIGAWLVFKGGSSAPENANTAAVREALKNVNCSGKDEEVCKFFASWKASRYFTATTTTKVGQTTNTSVLKVDGKNYHSKINSQQVQETIVQGDAVYFKDPEHNKWYKQKLDKPSTIGFAFNSSDLRSEGGAFTYKKAGTEPCGELTCYKYEIINAEDKGLTQFIWFDDQDYQLRKQTTEQKETATRTTTSFHYDKVTISQPSPYTELREGEYYLPGQGVIKPSDLPQVNADELKRLMNQYQP